MELHVDYSVSHMDPSVCNVIKLFFKIHCMIINLQIFNLKMYFQNHSYSHSYGMKKRASGSHKDPLVSSVLSPIAVCCTAVKFTAYF